MQVQKPVKDARKMHHRFVPHCQLQSRMKSHRPLRNAHLEQAKRWQETGACQHTAAACFRILAQNHFRHLYEHAHAQTRSMNTDLQQQCTCCLPLPLQTLTLSLVCTPRQAHQHAWCPSWRHQQHRLQLRMVRNNINNDFGCPWSMTPIHSSPAIPSLQFQRN